MSWIDGVVFEEYGLMASVFLKSRRLDCLQASFNFTLFLFFSSVCLCFAHTVMFLKTVGVYNQLFCSFCDQYTFGWRWPLIARLFLLFACCLSNQVFVIVVEISGFKCSCVENLHSFVSFLFIFLLSNAVLVISLSKRSSTWCFLTVLRIFSVHPVFPQSALSTSAFVREYCVSHNYPQSLVAATLAL